MRWDQPAPIGWAQWARVGPEGGGGCGEDGGLDRAGAGVAQGGGRAGEGAAGGGEVVDQQDPAAGEAAPGPGRRTRRRRLVRAGPAGAAEVAAAGWGEQVDKGEVEGGGDAGGDLLGVISGWAGDPAGGDVGDQVGPGSGPGEGGAETTAELGQGRRLAVELAGQHGGPEGIAVWAERPHRQVRVGVQDPRSDGPWLRRQAAGAARPRLRHPAGQAHGRSQQPP